MLGLKSIYKFIPYFILSMLLLACDPFSDETESKVARDEYGSIDIKLIWAEYDVEFPLHLQYNLLAGLTNLDSNKSVADNVFERGDNIIQVSQLPQGTYSIEFSYEEQRFTYKFTLDEDNLEHQDTLYLVGKFIEDLIHILSSSSENISSKEWILSSSALWSSNVNMESSTTNYSSYDKEVSSLELNYSSSNVFKDTISSSLEISSSSFVNTLSSSFLSSSVTLSSSSIDSIFVSSSYSSSSSMIQMSSKEEPSDGVLIMPDKIVTVPNDLMEFEDFVEPGIAKNNRWPFAEGDAYRQDKAKYNTPQNSNVYGMIVDYPDEGAEDSTGVEFQACLCHLEYRFESDGGSNDGSERGCHLSNNFPEGQEVTSSVFGGEIGPWNVCLTFLHAAETFTYVIDVPEKGDYNMYISANTANYNDPMGDKWTSESPGFNINLSVKDITLSETYLHFREPIIYPHIFPGDGPQWIKIRESEPQKISFPPHMPDRVVLIFKADGLPYYLDYIRFEKL